MTLNPADRVLLRLLAAAINMQEPALDKALSDPEWSRVYGQAAQQGVLAVAWESVRRLSPDLQPGRGLRLQWAYGAEQIVSRSKRQMLEAARFAALCTDAGCRLILLKGIGLARYYPRMRGYRHPSARRVREGERDRPMPGDEGFGAGL